MATIDADIFRAFVKAGQRLAEIHADYEKQLEYQLKKIEKKGGKLDYRVEKMKLSKDKAQLMYNKFLTLADIPPETYEYRLGGRSALEWIVDQYQASTDKRSGITNDSNREDDPQHVLRLIGQVITVSLETVSIVKALLPLITSDVKADRWWQTQRGWPILCGLCKRWAFDALSLLHLRSKRHFESSSRPEIDFHHPFFAQLIKFGDLGGQIGNSGRLL